MGFADECGVANGHFADPKGYKICCLHNGPCKNSCAGTANGGLAISPVKTYASGKTVYVRCFKLWVAVAGKIVPAQLVAHDEKNIFSIRHV